MTIADIKTRQQYDDEYHYRKVHTEVECDDAKIMSKLDDYQLEDEFCNSLRAAFKKYGSLTEKQRAALNKKIIQFEEVLVLLDISTEHQPDNAFIKSLDDFFLRYGWLSPKQIKSLKENVFKILS